MIKKLYSEAFFRRFGFLTVYSIFFLIFVGGWVRVTGSGMGCPDWPKCFDQWVPPTDVSELPEDYRTRFASPGKPVAEFNVVHTWTEYVNRLVGVLIGIFIAITMVSSFQFRKTEPRITAYAVLSFLLVGFQGWIGKVVVDKNLAGWMVTIHMLIALLVVGLVMLSVFRRHRLHHAISHKITLRNLSMLALLITLIQITSGTQVRERVDEVMLLHLAPDWIAYAGSLLTGHIVLSVLVFALSMLLAFMGYRSFKSEKIMKRVLTATLLCTAIQIISGIANRWMELPAIAQMSHILFGTLISGGWFYLWMVLNRKIASQEAL
ncbi:MAG: heme A synthase [Bacteroidetes bacterium]|nr:heme A synthase [Bacteroidota bacterium]